MARFLKPLMAVKVGHSGRRATWQLIEALVLDDRPETELWTIQAGFQTDYASVPRLPFLFLVFGDYAHASATIHDYLCTLKRIPPKVANEIFYRAMLAERVPRWRAWLMYLAVRLPIGRMD